MGYMTWMEVVLMPFALVLLTRTQSHDPNLTSRKFGKWCVPVCARK